MAVLNNTGIRMGASGASDTYTVKRSTRFNKADESALQKTFSSAGNRRTFTCSFWVKRSSAGSQRTIFSGNTTSNFNNGFQICFENADTFSCNGASPTFNLTTTQLFRDQSAWYHMVVSVDTTQPTASNRLKIYVNGERVEPGDFNLETYPSLNDELNCNGAVFHQIGGLGYVSSVDFDGYLADFHFVDGFAKVPGDFAETDETTGQWVPKEYTGDHNQTASFNDGTTWSSLVTNGSTNANYVPAKAFNGSISNYTGYSESNWTRSASDGNTPAVFDCSGVSSMADVVSAKVHFYISDNVNNNTIVEVNGTNITTGSSSGMSTYTVDCTGTGLDTIKYKYVSGSGPYAYFQGVEVKRAGGEYEALVDDRVGNGTNGFHLAMDPANTGTTYNTGLTLTNFNSANFANAWDGVLTTSAGNPAAAAYSFTGLNISGVTKVRLYFTGTNASWANQIVGVNGSYATTNPASGTAPGWIEVALGGATITLTSIEITNTTPGDSTNVSLAAIEVNDAILVDHSTIGYDSSGNGNNFIDNNLIGNEYTTATENFKAVSYTGTGSSQTIECGFKPDFVWIKKRSGGTARVHALYDSVRGVQKTLESNSTDEEYADTNALTHFTTTGFTVGSEHRVNENTYPYVAWCWKGGGAASSNSDGSVTSSVSANTTAGFSVVKYTMGGSDITVGHGLSAEPGLIITRRYDDTDSWITYHKSIGKDKYLFLNSADDAFTDTADAFTSTNSSVFDARAGLINAGDCIAYCWNETAGVSKFGSFAGSGSTVTIDCGFPPAYVLIKCHAGSTSQEWVIHTKTLGTPELFAESSSAETDSRVVNFLVNGFSINGGQGPVNYAGRDYVYIAFAGNPGGDLDLLADVPGAPYDNSLNGGGNYATWNPLSEIGTGTADWYQGNLQIAGSATSAASTFTSTQAASKFNCYAETENTMATGGMVGFGIALPHTSPNVVTGVGSYIVYREWGAIIRYPGNVTEASVTAWTNGDTVGVAVDSTNVKFYLNNTLVHTEPHGYTEDYCFLGMVYRYQGDSGIQSNFGQRAFKYTPPAGYKALNTYNWPDPTVKKSNSGFDIQKWTGNNTDNRDIDGYLFSPDLVWIKERGSTGDHHIFDTVRGANKALRANEPDAEVTTTDELKQFNSDGFRLGNGGDVNASSTTTIGWAWDAGSAGSNTAISAGGLNSSLYDQSQDWTDLITFNAGGWNGDGTNPFNDSATDYDQSTHTRSAGGYATLDISSLTGSRVISVTSEQTEVTVTHAGGTTTYTPSVTSRLTHTFDAVTNPTSIKFNGLNSGSVFVLVGVTVDGKRLINDDITPTTVPTLASEYRVNNDTGFSIVTFTDASTSGTQSIAHGLNDTPAFIILKPRDLANSEWSVFHKSFPSDALYLHLNNAKFNSSRWNSTAGTSNVFYWNDNSTNSKDIVAYVWSEVAGYSKFGSYTADPANPFIYCGFRPAFLMIKCTSHTGNWGMWDDVRSPYNTVQKRINAQSSAAEYDNAVVANDFLSNGFKVQTTDTDSGGSGRTYIFAAFAESPFKYSNAF